MASQAGSHEQHVKAGEQSHKNTGSQKNVSLDKGNSSSGSRGGSHEQHGKAGQKSHENS